MRKIIPRLLLGFLLLSPLPLAGLAWLYTHEFERALNETALGNLSAIADKKAGQINDYIDERKRDGQLLAQSEAVVRMLRPGKRSVEERQVAEASVRRNTFRALYELGGYYDILLIDASGKLAFSVRHQPDFDGNLDTGPNSDSILARGHREVLAKRDIRITPTRPHAQTDGRPAVFIIIPVLDKGAALGTLALQLDLEKLTATTRDRTGLGRTGEVLLAQQKDAAVYYLAPMRHLADAAIRQGVPIGELAVPMLAALGGAQGHGVKQDYAGIQVSAAWRHIPALNWGMVVKMDTAEALAPVRDLRRPTVAALAFLILAGVMIAILIGRSLLLPIRRLMAATGRIAAGDLSQRAPEGGEDEFSQLALSFNRMADQIEKDQSTLEARVVERSQALQESMARYDSLVKQIPVGVFICVLNAKGELAFEYVSPRFCQLVRQAEATLLAEPLTAFSFLYEDDVNEWVRFMRDMALAPVPFRHEYRYCIEGNIRWYRTEVDPTLLDDGGSRWNGTLTDITERKRTELALESSEMRFRSIFEHANTGITLIDPQRKLIQVNLAFAQLLGYDIAELQGQDLDRITYPEDILKGITLYRKHQSSGVGNDFRMEKRYFTKSGDLVWVDHSIAAICDENGKPSSFIGVVVDITERKRAEAQLQETLARLKRFGDALDSLSSYIHIKDKQHCYVYANKVLLDFLGITMDELVGRDDTAFFPPKAVARFQVTDDRVLEHGETTQELIEGPKEEGPRIFLLVKQPVFDDKGEISGLCAVVTDITERIQAEEATRKALDEQAAIFESATHGIAFIKDRIIVKCNHQLEELFGYGPGELTGQSSRVWYFDEGRFHVGRRIYPVLERGGVQRRTAAMRCKDGSSIWCRLSGRAVAAADPAAGVVWIIEDITQEHEAALAMVRAREAAEAANQAKSEFLANMSHEIRTPMNAILGLTQLVLESELSVRQADYLRKASNAGKALLGILNDILDYSKIEAGRMDIERVPLHLETILRDVADLFVAAIEEKGLELFVDIDPALPTLVLGDPLRLMQVLNNLLGNAVKFTERGEIEMRVALAGGGDETMMLDFFIRDTGIGLSPGQANRLFEAFTQADGTITRKFGGTGLGLAICQKLTMLMGGDIALVSEPGQGATFSFTIEVGRAVESEPPLDTQRLGAARILVVDEQETSRRILGQTLAGWHSKVDVVATPEAALLALEGAASDGHVYDFVIFDWQLSGEGGAALAYRLQAHRSRSGLAVPRLIAMASARDREALVAMANTLPLEAVLTKPVMPGSLFNTLSEACCEPTGHLEMGPRACASQRFDGAWILLVEDNALNQQVAAEFLRRRGIVVTVANDGAEAVEWVNGEHFDLILMDLHMPVMDGLEATRRIRELPAGRELPIIAMTAAVMREDRERCAAAGMNGFVVKPLDPDELARELCRWLTPIAPSFRGQPQSSEASPGGSLPDLAGFDLAQALRRLEGNQSLLERLLLEFANEHAATVVEISALLDAGERRQVVERLHALKGEAANLGAIALAAATQAFEMELRTDGPFFGRQAFEAALTAALATVTAYIGQPIAAGAHWEPQRVAALLSGLRRYLEQRELVPDELMAALQELATTDLPGAPLKDLLRRLDRFDHDGALALMVRIAANCGLEMGE